MNLENKIVIVAGGKGLIGREVVADLIRHGATVIDADISCSIQ